MSLLVHGRAKREADERSEKSTAVHGEHWGATDEETANAYAELGRVKKKVAPRSTDPSAQMRPP